MLDNHVDPADLRARSGPLRNFTRDDEPLDPIPECVDDQSDVQTRRGEGVPR